MGFTSWVGPEDGIDVLRGHHQMIRGLLNAVPEQPIPHRRRSFDQLCAALASHEAAEGLLLRPVTRGCVLGGEVVADSRLAEERRARDALDAMMGLDIASGQFIAAFGAFARALCEHMDSEETYEFPLVRAYRDEDALIALGTVLRRADSIGDGSGPPNPHAFAGAVISPLTSAMGRVRAAVTAVRP